MIKKTFSVIVAIMLCIASLALAEDMPGLMSLSDVDKVSADKIALTAESL